MSPKFATFAVVLLAASLAMADAARDPQAFTNDILERLRPHLYDGETISSPEPLKIKVKGRRRTVDAELKTLYGICSDKPDECEKRTGEYVESWTDLFGVPPAPDAAKLYAQLWTDTTIAFLERIGQVGTNPVAARYAGDLWTVCMSGTRPLKENDLSVLKLSKADAVARCQANTVAVQQPFDASIADLPKGGSARISNHGVAALLLAHDLWAPVSRRFDGALIVCAIDADILYYGRGADADDIAALETRARKEAADRVTTGNLDGIKGDPRDFHFAVLKWTETGWQVVS
jgi:hypothetical protein